MTYSLSLRIQINFWIQETIQTAALNPAQLAKAHVRTTVLHKFTRVTHAMPANIAIRTTFRDEFMNGQGMKNEQEKSSVVTKAHVERPKTIPKDKINR